jgi:hypothetical protein
MKSLLRHLLVNVWALFFLRIALIPANAADPLDTWTAVTASPTGGYQGEQLMGITYANGQYVAVGQYYYNDLGFTSSSVDGLNWTIPSPPTPILDLYDVTYGNGVFVAVGWDWYSGGNIYSSLDGNSWTRHSSTSGNVRGVTFGAGKFVAVGDGQLSTGSTNRNIYTSPDGSTWTARLSISDSVQNICDVAYGNGTFVAIDTDGYYYTSSTGTTWTMQGGLPGVQSVSFAKDRFFAAFSAGNMVSTDGLTWSLMVPSPAAAHFHRIIYQAPYFMGLSDSALFTSTDATNWTQRPLTTPTNTFLADLAAGQSNVVVVGYNYTNNNYYAAPLRTSQDVLLPLLILQSMQVLYRNLPFQARQGGPVPFSSSMAYPPAQTTGKQLQASV